MAPGLDTNRIAELYECTERAYDSEISQDWVAAYSLHETAQKQWSSFAGMAKFFSRADKVTKSLALRRAELHQQRMNILRPFVHGGKAVPKVLLMHPSKRLTMMGFSERVDLDQLAVATTGDLSEQSLPLTTVRPFYLCKVVAQHSSAVARTYNPKTAHPRLTTLYSVTI